MKKNEVPNKPVCGSPGCPGCVMLATAVEDALADYSPRSLDRLAWEQVAAQARCLVRRAAPSNVSAATTLLSALCSLIAGELADFSTLSVEQMLTDAGIGRHMNRLKSTRPDRTRTNVRARLTRLMYTRMGLPYRANNQRSSRPGESRPLSPEALVAVTGLCADTPLLTSLARYPLAETTLRRVFPHLPAADLHAYQGVLRGPGTPTPHSSGDSESRAPEVITSAASSESSQP
ncbi:MAG: hypothetical protein WCP28_04650 [Actinomycetes bacterium]